MKTSPTLIEKLNEEIEKIFNDIAEFRCDKTQPKLSLEVLDFYNKHIDLLEKGIFLCSGVREQFLNQQLKQKQEAVLQTEKEEGLKTIATSEEPKKEDGKETK